MRICYAGGRPIYRGQIIYAPAYWDDLRVPATVSRIGSSNPPTFKQWGATVGIDEVYAWHYSATIKEDLYFSAQFPHRLKEGTDWRPHVHWSPTTVGAGNVVWRLSWRWANVGAVFPAVTGSSVTAAASGTIDDHLADSFPTISAPGSKISAMLVGRIARLGNDAADTYGGEAVLHELDFHYQLDTPGSRSEFVK